MSPSRPVPLCEHEGFRFRVFTPDDLFERLDPYVVPGTVRSQSADWHRWTADEVPRQVAVWDTQDRQFGYTKWRVDTVKGRQATHSSTPTCIYRARVTQVVLGAYHRSRGGREMDSTETERAVAAAMSSALALGLEVDDAVVLNDSNRFVVRLMPCDTVARVTPTTHHAGHQVSPEREVEVVRRLAQTDSPVAGLDARVEPRIVMQDGFEIAFWTYCEWIPSLPVPPADYARALGRLHAGLREIAVTTPHAMDRVAAAQHDVASRDVTPDLTDADRGFLATMLRDLRGAITSRHAPEQLLHGEPHSGNVLSTNDGPLLIDFENTSHGPVEYDLGWVPQEVADRYSGADQDLVGECRGLVLAMVAAYRWRRDDQHPSGRESGFAFLNALRDGPPWRALDDVTW